MSSQTPAESIIEAPISGGIIQDNEKIIDTADWESPGPIAGYRSVEITESASAYPTKIETKISAEKKTQKKLKIPENNDTPAIPSEKKILLGISQDGLETIELNMEAMKRHMLVIGMTGSGKTTLLERMMLQDIDAGRGVGLIDPH